MRGSYENCHGVKMAQTADTIKWCCLNTILFTVLSLYTGCHAFPRNAKCCDNETEGYPNCLMSFYKLQKALPELSESSSDIRVGDIIVL